MKTAAIAVALTLATSMTYAGNNSVIGDWTMVMEMRGRQMERHLHIEQAGDGLSGTFSGDRGTSEVSDITFDGKKLSFAIVRESPRGEFRMEFEGELAGDRLIGKLNSPMGASEMTGTRGWDASKVREEPSFGRGRGRRGRPGGERGDAPEAPSSDAPGEITFRAHNGMYKAHGKFNAWRFTSIDIPDGDLEKGKIEIEVDLASVWEKAKNLADHLRTADFFDVEKFAKATIKIDGAKKGEDGSYIALAEVAFHGHTDDVPIRFEVTSESPLTVRGSAVLSRTAFGIGGPHDPDSDRSIIDEIEIQLSAKLDG